MPEGLVSSARTARAAPLGKACLARGSIPATIRTRVNSLSIRRVSEVAGCLSAQMFRVIGSSWFLTETSWRTMDGETGTKGRPFLPPRNGNVRRCDASRAQLR
jgi:hypothetical protein